MSGLAVAVFAASTGEHLLDEPRSLRFARFVRGFDEERYRRDLALKGLRWFGRDDPGFPSA